MDGEAAYLVVARFVKPHGLYGEALVFPMTEDPEAVFEPGRTLQPVTVDGEAEPEDAVVIARSRPYQRRWLLAFEGIERRSDLESWPQRYLGALESELGEETRGALKYRIETGGN